MTTLTATTVLLMVYGALGRSGYSRALALGAATPVGAAAVIGAIAVPTFYAVAVGALAGVLYRFLSRRGREDAVDSVDELPGLPCLVMLTFAAILVTLVAPFLFDGLAVLTPAGPGGELRAGVVTKSNVAQIIYLLLSVSVVIFIARDHRAGVGVLGLAVCSVTVLSFWAYCGNTFGVPFPRNFFDNSPGYIYQETLPGGGARVRGILSEPAGLAASSLTTLAFALTRMRTAGGGERWLLVVVSALALYLGWISTSATFYVAGAALAVIAVVVGLGGALRGHGPVSRLAVVIGCAAVIGALWALPILTGILSEVINGKVGSDSYNERSGADALSLQIFKDTYGFGVGLGSNRSSSFASSILSTVGLVGAVLFVLAIWIVISKSWVRREVRPVVWSLIALLIVKTISGPDLSDSSGVLWISVGLLMKAALGSSQDTVSGERLSGASSRGIAASPPRHHFRSPES